MKRGIFSILSFIAGFSLMTIELVSSRIVAPMIGTSVYTWTSLIGITLLGLALGSYFGGRIADRFISQKTLPLTFLLASFLTFLISLLSYASNWIVHSSNSIIFLTILLSSYLFLLPAIAIGLIQPIVVKKYVDDFSELGRKYGWLSTLWSVGSILGVFTTGFYFISHIGSRETIYLISILLACAGFASAFSVREKKLGFCAIGIIIVVCLSWAFTSRNASKNSGVVYHKETAYYDAKVIDFNFYPYGPSRALVLDFDAHSIETKGPIKVQTYEESYPFFGHLKSDLKNILVIGAGAYTLPKNLKSFYPGSNVTVMEIDPETESISQKYFNFDASTITTKIGDARVLITQEKNKYDLVFGDAFNSFVSVPGYLLTQEFNTTVKNTLTKDGIYAINFIGSVSGKDSEMFKSLYATFSAVFPNKYVLHWNTDLSSIQNIVLVGVNGNSHKDPVQLKKELTNSTSPLLAAAILINPENLSDSSALILTDNFYPTEKLMSATIKDYYPSFSSFMDKLYGRL